MMNEHARGLTILFVDDSNMQLDYECLLLADQGFVMLRANSGDEAVAMACQHQPDVILMDIEMPGMNGIEAAQTLRQMEQTRAIPIIMVSAKSDEEAMEAAFISGCSDYLTKPMHRDAVLAKISGLTGWRSHGELL